MIRGTDSVQNIVKKFTICSFARGVIAQAALKIEPMGEPTRFCSNFIRGVRSPPVRLRS
jgi:hypothetical protein